MIEQTRVAAIPLCLLMVALAGCGATYSLKEFLPQDGQPKTALIDIKQRAILSGKRQGQTGPATNEIVMCAEPSPDALTSLASEFAADAKYRDSLQATLGFSQQESASFVGLRTQTIQLLRDGMYRLCEGYLSGALTQADFAWLSRRYQRNMVALLTIEQLTRVAQVPTLSQTSQGLASASRSATAIQADLEALDKNLIRLTDEKKKLTDEKADIDKLPDTDTAKAGKLKDVQGRLDANQASAKSTDEIRGALLEGLKTAKGVLTSGSTTVQIVADTQDRRLMQSDVVSTAIAGIADKVLDQDDLPTLCFQILDGSRASPNVHEKLKEHCLKVIESRATLDNAKADLLRKIDPQKFLDPRSRSSSPTSPFLFEADDRLRKLLRELGINPVANVPDMPKLFTPG